MQLLHGGFEAQQDACYNLNPHALGYDEHTRSSAYPAQVPVQRAFQAQPVPLQAIINNVRDLFYSLSPPKMAMQLTQSQASPRHTR